MIDDILDIIDAGLQSSTETGYPERYDREGGCARCLANEPVEGGDMCAGCRSFLLGDTDVDPKVPECGPGAWVWRTSDVNDAFDDIDLTVWQAPEYPLPLTDLNPYLDVVRDNVRLLAAEAGFTMQEWQEATLGAWAIGAGYLVVRPTRDHLVNAWEQAMGVAASLSERDEILDSDAGGV